MILLLKRLYIVNMTLWDYEKYKILRNKYFDR